MKTIYFFFTLLIFSCASETDFNSELSKKVKHFLRNDNIIDEKEWLEITKYLKINKDFFQDFYENEEINNLKVKKFIIDLSKERRGQEIPEIFIPSDAINSLIKPKINIFIENSGSMDGYVRGIRDFELVVGKLLVLSKDYCTNNSTKNFDIFFINKLVYPAPEIKELTDFANDLEPKENSPYFKGDRSESILNDVLRNIVDSTNINSISILVSDCIYSLDPTKDTKGSLGYQQNGTMEVFLNKFRNNTDLDLTTCIYKFTSDYEGNYFPYNYNPRIKNSINLINKQAKRPYYIWVLGESQKVAEFIQNIKFEELKGFQNSYILSNNTNEKKPYYSVLKETNKIGSFKQTDRNEKDLKRINKVEFEGGKLQFAIAIDLGNIPVDYSYLINPNNYFAEGFSIVSIEKIDRNKLSKRDFLIIEKTPATHFITVSTTSNLQLQDLVLELSNKLPIWIEQTNSMDDTNVEAELDKTFGFSYLIKGVSDAYSIKNTKHSFYFKITVNINK